MPANTDFGNAVADRRPARRAQPGSREHLPPVYLITMFLLGFSIPFPGLLLPGQLFSPRYPDLFVIVAIPLAWLLYNRDFGTYAAHKTTLLWTAAVVVAMIVQSLTFTGVPATGDWVFYLRWIASIAVAVPLSYVLPGRRDLQRVLLMGIAIGSAWHLVTILIATAGGTDLLRQIGFASRRVLSTSYYGESRITSLAEHPNFAMILLGMSLPAAFAYRLLSPPNDGRVMMGVAVVVASAGFYLTLTRSAAIACIFAFLAAQMQMAKRRERIARFFPVAFGALLIVAIAFAIHASGTLIESDRLADRIVSTGLDENMQGRVSTIEGTLALLFKYPFGVGWTEYLSMGNVAAHLRSSHNGYLFAARTAGLPIALLLLIGHGRLLWRMASTRRIDALAPLAVFLVVVMFAEDVTQGMSMTFLAVMLAAAGFRPMPWASTTYRSVLVPRGPRSAEELPVEQDRA